MPEVRDNQIPPAWLNPPSPQYNRGPEGKQYEISRGTTYENLPAPVSPALRRAVWWGIALCAVSLCIYLLLPIGAASWHDSDFFLLLGEQFVSILSWTADHIVPFLLLSLLGIVFGIVLIAASGGLKQVRRESHVLAFIVIVMGVLCSLPLVAALTIVVINLIAGIVIAVVQLVIVIVVIALLLAALFGVLSR